VGQVAGQILACHLLGDHAVAVEQRLKFVRVTAGALVGQHPWRAQVRERTGAAVVAVERDRNVFVKFEDAFEVCLNDTLFLCGTTGSLDQYLREFQAKPADSPRA
jgi:K+/H+ antiporter YhaU regulatory subunit KhtT